MKKFWPLCLIIPFIICWLGGSFIGVELNMFRWEQDSRAMYAIFSLLGDIVVTMIFMSGGSQ